MLIRTSLSLSLSLSDRSIYRDKRKRFYMNDRFDDTLASRLFHLLCQTCPKIVLPISRDLISPLICPLANNGEKLANTTR